MSKRELNLKRVSRKISLILLLSRLRALERLSTFFVTVIAIRLLLPLAGSKEIRKCRLNSFLPLFCMDKISPLLFTRAEAGNLLDEPEFKLSTGMSILLYKLNSCEFADTKLPGAEFNRSSALQMMQKIILIRHKPTKTSKTAHRWVQLARLI